MKQKDSEQAKARESVLLGEISVLKREMGRQNQLFRENRDVVSALQDQLRRLEIEQTRLTQRELVKKPESRICTMM